MAKRKPWLNKNLLTLCLGQNLKNVQGVIKKIYQNPKKETINLIIDKVVNSRG